MTDSAPITDLRSRRLSDEDLAAIKAHDAEFINPLPERMSAYMGSPKQFIEDIRALLGHIAYLEWRADRDDKMLQTGLGFVADSEFREGYHAGRLDERGETP